MIDFLYEDDITIKWDTDKTFVVCRDGVTINSFEEQETLTMEKARLIADEWLGDMLQEEMLDHADEMYNEEDDWKDYDNRGKMSGDNPTGELDMEKQYV